MNNLKNWKPFEVPRLLEFRNFFDAYVGAWVESGAQYRTNGFQSKARFFMYLKKNEILSEVRLIFWRNISSIPDSFQF